MSKLALRTAVAALALFAATPAVAGVIISSGSTQQGTLVHGTGVLQEDVVVTGNLGAGGPNIVNFDADTDESAATSGEDVRMQQGQGQADVTGAEIMPGGPANDADLYNLISGNIYLDNHDGMTWIEFGLTGLTAGTVDFIITLNGTTPVSFLNVLLGSGDTHYGFLATDGDEITNVYYEANNPPSELTILKQVRIDLADDVPPIPEPGTWALMLLGFGAAGFAIRRARRRDETALQIA